MPVIPGPHSCIGTSKATIDFIFDRLAKACMNAGGSLTAAELAAARKVIEASFTKSIDFSAINAACRSAFKHISIDLADARNLSAVVFYAYLQDLLKICFQGQISRKSDWHRSFCLALVELCEEQFKIAIRSRLKETYEAAAMKSGAQIQMKELTDAPATVAAMSQVLNALQGLLVDQAAQRAATDIVNRSLMESLDVRAPNVFLISRTSIVRFVEKLDKFGTNRLRTAAFERNRTIAAGALPLTGE
ncbi:hypothetical protein HPQ64_16610 [Rhizobiales bacterium]|uniref:hypothetical protein n=1 Tax=Hongsoonwoonella zoysiae TaxID=2821844 RepID=UPI00155FF3E5|nr:hypothetical protein [Hongsoonwoonella zoysiae]NRG19315.1 hypothetical protein [Hongsoonwoonella zoysiae]